MASAIYFTFTNSVAPPPSPTVATALAQYGDNGSGNGPDPEFEVTTPAATSAGRTTWQANNAADGSWDTGEVPVGFYIGPYGQGTDIVTFTVNGETPVSEVIPAPTSIIGVDVNAGTQTNGSVQWSDLNIVFSNESSNETWTGTGPAVDTTAAANPLSESDVTVNPDMTNADGIYLSGNVRMTLPPNSYPNPDDLFADIYVIGS